MDLLWYVWPHHYQKRELNYSFHSSHRASDVCRSKMNSDVSCIICEEDSLMDVYSLMTASTRLRVDLPLVMNAECEGSSVMMLSRF